MWDYLLKFVAFTLLSELFRPKPKIDRPAAAGLKDLGLPTADEKRPLPWLIGRAKQDAPNLVATYDFKAVPRTSKVRTGILSTTTVPKGYDYYVGAAMTLCAGQSVFLREIWAGSGDDAVRIWSGNAVNGQTITLNYEKVTQGQEDYPQGFKGVLEFHSGTTNKSPYLTAKVGNATDTPAFSHATYVVLRGADTSSGMWVGATGQVLPLSFVIERRCTSTSVGLGTLPPAVAAYDANGDANAAYAIAEILTHTGFWAGEHRDFINAQSFFDAAATCAAEDHFVGTLIDQQRPSGDVAFELCRQIGALLQPDPTTGNHTLKLLRAGDTPVLTLNDSNIERLSSFSRAAQDEATNTLTVNYLDRAAGWKNRPLTVQDLAAVETAGSVIATTQQYSALTSAARADLAATRDLRATSAPLATARLTAIVPKRQRLMPGDLVVFGSGRNGIGNLRMRVTSARFSEPGRGTCELELLEDVFSSGLAVYARPLSVTPSATLQPPGQIGSTVFGWPNALVAPRAISGAVSNQYHAIFFAGADSANAALGYRLGYNTGAYLDSTTAAWHERGTIGFAAKGVSTVSIATPAAGTTIAVTVSAADAETIKRNGSREVFILHDWRVASPTQRYWHKGYATLTGATTATITLTAVQVYGDIGSQTNITATDDLWLLYDYAIDPVPIATTYVSGSYRTAGGSSCRAQTVGAGGLGSFSPLPWPRDIDYTMDTGKTLPTWSSY